MLGRRFLLALGLLLTVATNVAVAQPPQEYYDALAARDAAEYAEELAFDKKVFADGFVDECEALKSQVTAWLVDKVS